MKFGKYLESCQANAPPLFAQGYVEYGYLKSKLKVIAATKQQNSIDNNTLNSSIANIHNNTTSVSQISSTSSTSSTPSRRLSSLTINDNNNKPTNTSSIVPGVNTQDTYTGLLREWVLLLETEISKIDKFITARIEEAKTIISQLSRKCEHIIPLSLLPDNNNSVPPFLPSSIPLTPQDIERLYIETDKLLVLLLDVDRFINLNYTALSKITKKHDKITGLSTRTWILARLDSEAWTNPRLDGFLVIVSEIYNRLRQGQEYLKNPEQFLSTGGVWTPPETFARNTTKFWVRRDDIFRLKALLIRSIPILVFGKDTSKFKAVTPLEKNRVTEETDAGSISSVYLDNKTLDVYHTRIARQDNASLTRVRWYGADVVPPADAKVFIERKTHHDKNESDDPSLKERFMIRCGKVAELLDGTLDIDAYLDSLVAAGDMGKKSAENARKLATEIQNEVQERGLYASVRTVYRRTAFQLATSNDVRISLDTDMVLINENATDPNYEKVQRKPGMFCSDITSCNLPGAAIPFPYAILEIKLAGEETPAWVHSILASGIAIPIKKFSKFLTAITLFHKPKLNPIPHWFIPDQDMALIEPPQPATAAVEALVACDIAPDTESAGSIMEEEHQKTLTVGNNQQTGLHRYILPLQLPESRTTFTGTDNDDDDDDNDNNPTSPKGIGNNNGNFPNKVTMNPLSPLNLPNSFQAETTSSTVVVANPLSRKSGLVSTLPSSSSTSSNSSTGGGVSIFPNENVSNGNENNKPPPTVATAFYPTISNTNRNPTSSFPNNSNERTWYHRIHRSYRHLHQNVRTSLGFIDRSINNAIGPNEQTRKALQNPRTKVKVKVEPKTHFANERTMLLWVQISLLIFGIASGLLGLGTSNSRNMAIVMILTGFCLLFYGLRQFYSRIYKINNNSVSGYEDRYGPLVLVILIFVAMIINISLTFSSGAAITTGRRLRFVSNTGPEGEIMENYGNTNPMIPIQPVDKSIDSSYIHSYPSVCERVIDPKMNKLTNINTKNVLQEPFLFHPSSIVLTSSLSNNNNDVIFTTNDYSFNKFILSDKSSTPSTLEYEEIRIPGYRLQGLLPLTMIDSELSSIVVLISDYPKNNLLIYDTLSKEILSIYSIHNDLQANQNNDNQVGYKVTNIQSITIMKNTITKGNNKKMDQPNTITFDTLILTNTELIYQYQFNILYTIPAPVKNTLQVQSIASISLSSFNGQIKKLFTNHIDISLGSNSMHHASTVSELSSMITSHIQDIYYYTNSNTGLSYIFILGYTNHYSIVQLYSATDLTLLHQAIIPHTMTMYESAQPYVSPYWNSFTYDEKLNRILVASKRTGEIWSLQYNTHYFTRSSQKNIKFNELSILSSIQPCINNPPVNV